MAGLLQDGWKPKPMFANIPAVIPKAAQTAAKKVSGRGGIATSLISEGGGTAGAVAGGAIGTALLPGLGTIIGAGLGGLLGGTGGRLVENKVRDNEYRPTQALKEGAITGLFSAGPIRLAKLGVGTGAAVKGGSTLAEALVQAGTKAAGSSALKTAGSKVTQEGDRFLVKSFRLNRSQLNNFRKSTGEDAVQVIKRFGISKPDDVLAKGIEPLQQAFDSAVERIPAVSKADLGNGLKSVYMPLKKSVNLTERGLGQQLETQAKAIMKLPGDTIDPQKLNGLRKSFDAAVKYTQRGAPDYNVNKETADALRTILQKAGDAAGVGHQGKTLKEIGHDLHKLYQLNDIIDAQTDLGRGNLIGSLPTLLGGGIGAGAVGGPSGAVLGVAGTAAINSNAGRRAIAQGTEAAGRGLGRLGQTTVANAYKAPMVAARIGAGRQVGQALFPEAAASAQGVNPPVNDVGYLSSQDSSLSPTQYPPTTTNSGMSTPQTSNSLNITPSYTPNALSVNTQNSPISRESALEAMLIDIQSTGGKNLSKIQALYDFANPSQPDAQAPKRLNATQQQQSNNAISALQDLSLIRQSIQRDPRISLKANLPGGSLTQRLTGSGEYEAARKNIGDVLARLRSGAAITNDEYRRYIQLLPASFDSPQVAESKLQRLEGLLSSFAYAEPAATTTEDALMQYAQPVGF